MKITFPMALFLVFLVLKLTHTIAWSWWWVSAPLWGGLAVWAAIMGVLLVVAFIATIREERDARRR